VSDMNPNGLIEEFWITTRGYRAEDMYTRAPRALRIRVIVQKALPNQFCFIFKRYRVRLRSGHARGTA
jgi:hypothetical protein